jgi:DNA-binding response OmpR family regulator
LVEDESGIADFISRGLRSENYTVTVATTGTAGMELAQTQPFDMLILDNMLPGFSGMDICKTLRAANNKTPILILSALSEVDDRVSGLGSGADDYLSKPFAFTELLARMEALIRRAGDYNSDGNCLHYKDIKFDLDRMDVSRAGITLSLTVKELGILELLMSKPGNLVSREKILEQVWGTSEDPLTNVVDVYIARLRKKLEENAAPVIQTVRGYGYRLIL